MFTRQNESKNVTLHERAKESLFWVALEVGKCGTFLFFLNIKFQNVTRPQNEDIKNKFNLL